MVDLRSDRDEIQDDPLGFDRVGRQDHSDAVAFQSGGGTCNPPGLRCGTELTPDGWIEIELKLGGHGPLLFLGFLGPVCLRLHIPYDQSRCTCKYFPRPMSQGSSIGSSSMRCRAAVDSGPG